MIVLHSPQMVVEGLNALVGRASIEDVVFALCDVSEARMKPERYYLVRYGYFATAEQLGEEGRGSRIKATQNMGGGWIFDAESDDGGTGICVYKLGDELYHIGGWDYCRDE